MEAHVLEPNLSELFTDYYFQENTYDEVFKKNLPSSPYYNQLLSLISSYSAKEFNILNESTKKSFINRGVTFATYSDNPKGNERIFPFDLFPRIIPYSEWRMLEKGLKQRNRAINLFIDDLYHDSKTSRRSV